MSSTICIPRCDNLCMAATIKARAGSAFKATIRYWTDDTKTTLVNTTGYTARLQLRAVQPPARVLLDSAAVDVVDENNIPPGTVFGQLEPGRWRIFLGKTLTKTLPPTVRFEVELTNIADPEDTILVCAGSIQVQPQGVSGAE